MNWVGTGIYCERQCTYTIRVWFKKLLRKVKVITGQNHEDVDSTCDDWIRVINHTTQFWFRMRLWRYNQARSHRVRIKVRVYVKVTTLWNQWVIITRPMLFRRSGVSRSVSLNRCLYLINNTWLLLLGPLLIRHWLVSNMNIVLCVKPVPVTIVPGASR